MRSSRFVVSVLVASLLVVAMPAGAQNFPMPTKEGEAIKTFEGKKLYPYSSPYNRHVGRFVDSTFTTTYYAYPRTLRAKGLSIDQEHGRVYAMIGEYLVTYNLSTFFTQDLGSPLTSAIVSAATRKSEPEQYLPWSRHTYPEERNSGWKWYVLDGLDRVYDYAWDDRGYTYAAYSVWGWGVLDTNMKLIKQVEENSDDPRTMSSFKVDGKYYLLVSGVSAADIWDVTQPTSPVKVRQLAIGVTSSAVASAGGTQVIGVVANVKGVGSEVRLYRGRDLILGGSPFVNENVGAQDLAIDTDGTNFYSLAIDDKNRRSTVGVYTLTSNSGPNYTHKAIQFNDRRIVGLRYGSGHITLWGSRYTDTREDIWLFRLENGDLAERDLGDFYKRHYGSRGDAEYYGLNFNSYTGFSPPFGETLYVSHGGKEYLVISAMGLGDVYELESPDRLNVSVEGVVGMTNPNTPSTSNGTFYGDPIRFSANYSAGQVNVNWNFGNPEGIAGQNQQTLSSNQNVTYQYAGLTSQSAISASKTVTVTDTTNSGNSATATVSMKVPTARVRLAGTSNYLPGTDLSTVGVVAGDKFVDASDGTVQSHYGDWNLGGTTVSAAAGTAVSVGTCGLQTLNYTARYVPYSVSGTTVTPALGSSQHFTRTVGPISYEVRPFIPAIEVSSTGDNLTFTNRTRYSSGSFEGGSQWTVVWALRNTSGAVVGTPETDASVIGTADTFVVSKSLISAGYEVEMIVTVTPESLVEASCAAAGYLTASAVHALEPPDPAIQKSGCTMANEPCELSVTSISGADVSNWAITWYLDGTISGTGPTFSPNFTEEGTHQVRALAVNEIGTREETTSFSIAAPACVAPGAFSMSWKGLSTGCVGSSCTSASESFKFTASPWKWNFESCHNFKWDFGDGTQSSDESPTKKFSKNGTYTIKLTISTDSDTVTESIVMSLPGGSDPNPTPTCSAPRGASPGFSGTTSGCTPGNSKCQQGESIRFTGDAWQYNIQPSCDSFRWTFGDGGSSTSRHPSHVYNTPGTYTVQFTIRNSGGSTTGETSVTIEPKEAEDPCPKVPVVTGISAVDPGGKSCVPGSGNTGCLPNEQISFSAQTWQYNFQDCDVFLWEFGDGTTSNAREPKHTYTQSGEPTVKLTVSNTKGSSGTVSTMILIGTPANAPTSANFTFSPGHPKPGEAVTFAATTAGGDPASSWSWNFGDGSTGSGETVTHTFVTEGKYKVSLTAANSGGSVFAEKDVSVTDTLTYILPVVTHIAGSNDSSWRTDLHVFQPEFTTTGPIEVQLDFKGASKTIFFDSSTEIFDDVLGEITSLDDAGPVFLHSPVPIEMWTRTYNLSASGVGTYGQLIPATLLGESGVGAVAGETFWNIGGLKQGDRFRTNLGFVNPSSQPAVVTVHIYEEQFGLELGKFDVTVNPHELRQHPFKTWFSTLPHNQGFSLRIESKNGVDLISYASIIDNISNDPVFVGAVKDSTAARPEGKTLLVPGVGHVGTWRSDVTMFNPDSQAVSVDLEFYDEAGSKLGAAPGVVLPSKGSLTVEDILRSSVMNVEADTLGTLKVTTTSQNALYPIIYDRTYNDQLANGTFGQGIPAFPMSTPNAQFEAPAFIPGVRNDSAYRTNVGIVSLSTSEGSEVTIQLLHPNTGLPTHSNTIFLEPNSSKIIPRAISDFLRSTSATGTIQVVVQSGAPVWAYGSVIDNLTGDPEYVPAVPAAPGTAATLEPVE